MTTNSKLSPEFQAIRADQAKAKAMLKEHDHKLDATIKTLLKSNHPDNFREGLKLAEEALEAGAADLTHIEKLLEDANNILDGDFSKEVQKRIRQIKNSKWIINIVKLSATKIRNVGALEKAVEILRKEEGKARRAAEEATNAEPETPVVEEPVEETPATSVEVEPEPREDSVDLEELIRRELSPGSEKPRQPGHGRSRSDRGRGRGHSRTARRR